jgi:alcohol dehydrogenase (cytochrome c)
MPPANPGSLDETASISLAAFILAANGATPGDRALTAASTFTIRSVATGRPAIALEAGGLVSSAIASGPRGLTVTGEVKNYVPVTDAMLRDPDPGDWLMIRRNYQAWSHSPLTQIDTANVKQLQLVWSWAMNDSTAANEPTPIIHNGVMFLASPGNIVQALEARSGELIWENRVGPDLSNGQGAIRSLALYHGRAAAGTGRAQRQGCLGNARRRSGQGLRQHERPADRPRQGHPGHGRVRSLQGNRLLH